MKRAGWKMYDAPDNPFGNERCDLQGPAKESRNGRKHYLSGTSGLLPATANNQQYKMTFLIDGKKVDPDVVCGDPPPR